MRRGLGRSVPGYGTASRGYLGSGDKKARSCHAAGQGPDHDAGGRRLVLCEFQRHRSSRREAGQYHAAAGRFGKDHGFRNRPRHEPEDGDDAGRLHFRHDSYMAPEQFEPVGKADEQTDIFSFADVYYELLTGIQPFTAPEIFATIRRIITYEPEAVSQLVPGCPETLELLVHRALAKDREVRYASFAELLLDSEAVLVDLGMSARCRFWRRRAR